MLSAAQSSFALDTDNNIWHLPISWAQWKLRMVTALFMWIVGNGDFFIKWGCILPRKRKQDWRSWKGKMWLFILLSVLAFILTIWTSLFPWSCNKLFNRMNWLWCFMGVGLPKWSSTHLPLAFVSRFSVFSLFLKAVLNSFYLPVNNNWFSWFVPQQKTFFYIWHLCKV